MNPIVRQTKQVCLFVFLVYRTQPQRRRNVSSGKQDVAGRRMCDDSGPETVAVQSWFV